MHLKSVPQQDFQACLSSQHARRPVLTFLCLMFISDKRNKCIILWEWVLWGPKQRTGTGMWREIPGAGCEQLSQSLEEYETTYIVALIVFRFFHVNIFIFLTSAAQIWDMPPPCTTQRQTKSCEPNHLYTCDKSWCQGSNVMLNQLLNLK